MIEIIGDVREATEEEKKELESRENSERRNWKEVMLRKFLRGHYDKN